MTLHIVQTYFFPFYLWKGGPKKFISVSGIMFKTEHPVPTRIQFQYFSFLLVMLQISGTAAEFLKQKVFN
jgi:hypothetical protein